MGKITSIHASAGKGKYRIDAEAKCIGDAISVSVWGGTNPHIGSVVISIPRPSLIKMHAMSSTSSVFNFTGHKDEVVARMISEKITSLCASNTIVTAGVHIDNMTKSELKILLANAEDLCAVLIRRLKKKQ